MKTNTARIKMESPLSERAFWHDIKSVEIEALPRLNRAQSHSDQISFDQDYPLDDLRQQSVSYGDLSVQSQSEES